jgi:hypothetical protein
MGDSDKDEKMLEELDRLLEGKDVDGNGPSDEDTRSALDIARKIADMSDNPSEEFRQNLKAHLVHQLSEQEKKSESFDHDLNYWGVPRRKLWQGTIAALITVAVVAVILVIVLLLTK